MRQVTTSYGTNKLISKVVSADWIIVVQHCCRPIGMQITVIVTLIYCSACRCTIVPFQAGQLAADLGVEAGPHMTPECAVVKMMFCLAHPDIPLGIPIAGELGSWHTQTKSLFNHKLFIYFSGTPLLFLFKSLSKSGTLWLFAYASIPCLYPAREEGAQSYIST